MRAYGAEHDPPDGVAPLEVVAASVAADLKRARRGAAARGVRVPILGEKEARRRSRLLDKARRGDPAAIQTLWDRYRVRLVSLERRCACGRLSCCKDGRCKSCYGRDWKRARGSRPRYQGPCVECGTRPGRSISERCAGCYRRRFWRERGLARAWRRATGSDRTLQQVRMELLGFDGTPAQREALDTIQRLLASLQEGRMLLERNPWPTRRGRGA